MKEFREWLIRNKNEKKVRLFFDIETLQYNQKEGKEKPSLYKNVVYSVAVGYFNEFECKVVTFPNFKFFFNFIFKTWERWLTLPQVELIAHNNNKYDNHFLRKDLLFFYPKMKLKNLYLKNACSEGNEIATKQGEVTKKEKKDGIILEKRIKSSNNLELIFFKNNIKFFTTDNYMKTNVSIATLGKKLLRINKINKNDLKTDYNYEKYNLDEDMEDNDAYEYARYVYENLNSNELLYIRNDIIILANSVMYYSEIFKGFDYDKITFTSNILEHYNDNEVTNYQLLRKIKISDKKYKHIKYTDYKFNNQNFYDYLKKFYAGGLNIYNTNFLGTIVEDLFSIDINSSYPFAMHNFKIPTFFHSAEKYGEGKKQKIEKHNDNFFILYEMKKEKFDSEIIEKIESNLLQQILVKYYGKHSTININSYTIKLIEYVTNLKINELTLITKTIFECYYFGSREHISNAYYIKTQGSNDNIINYKSPYDIELTNIVNKNQYSREEIDNSKVILNGLYGIPALRPYFNLFRISGNEIHNFENGYANSERNIVFSVFVTSVSLFNLLSPLHYLSMSEIDNNIIYMDTDSLYIKEKVRNNIPNSFFHSMHLGKWDIQDEHIDKMYVLNHKKYAYLTNDKIKVKCGGIVNESFNLDMDFENFIETQFSHGVEIKNTKSILNKQGTVSIYPSITRLEIGQGYPRFSYDENLETVRKRVINKAYNEMKNGGDDVMYIESNIGTYSLSELFPVKNEVTNKLPLLYLEFEEEQIKTNLNL